MTKNPHSKWQPEWNALIGTKTDKALAEQLGVSRVTVQYHKRKAGKTRVRDASWSGRGGTSLLQQHWLPVLGTKPDRVHAEEFGVTPQTVKNWRTKQQIRIFPQRFGARRIAESLLDTLRFIAHDPRCEKSPCLCGLQRVKSRAEAAICAFNERETRKRAK